MNQGWVSIHRKILENPVAKKPDYAWLWIVLLLKANHEDKHFIFNNKKMECKRGQIYTGREALSKETGIHRSTIERALKYFIEDGQIEQQTYNKFRLITVINYDKYQSCEQQMSNKRATNEQQASTNNNVNNDNKLISSKNFKDGDTFTLHDGTIVRRYFGKWVDDKCPSLKLDEGYYPELKNLS